MAQTKKKTGASSGKKRTASRSAPAKQPHRREIGAVVCLALGVFAFIGFFSSNALFIGFFRRLLRGLFGCGVYAWPFILFLASAILGFHRGRPVAARVVAALSIGLVLSALLHLFISDSYYDLSAGIMGRLWAGGQIPDCGGALGGIIAEALEALFSKVGTAILLICCFILLLLVSLNKTVAGVADAIKNRKPLPKYEPQPEPEPVARQPKKPVPAPQEQTAQSPRRRRRVIDIPLDDPDAPPEPRTTDEVLQPKKDSLFNARPNVKTPAELLEDQAEARKKPEAKTEYIPEPEIVPEPEPGPVIPPAMPFYDYDSEAAGADAPQGEDVPLDIPFMESPLTPVEKTSRPASGVIPPEPEGIRIESASVDSETLEPEPVEPIVPEPDPEPESALKQDDEAGEMARELNASAQTAAPAYVFPPIELLSTGSGVTVDAGEEMRLNSERLESTFSSFGVNVKIKSFTHGPTVTRYEAELEAGVKLSKLTGLSDDIAMHLGVDAVRIAAMSNKISTVGIEVPNKLVSSVHLRDVIDSPEFRDAKSKLTFAVGKNIAGDVIVGNISKLPHLLVAGTTGSGKSVCLNSMILSLLYKATPDEVRMIMIDPKMVEFIVYNGLPHLLVPVVTDVKKAAGALQWAVVEMMKRYRLFSEAAVRDIDSYNDHMHRTGEGAQIPKLVVVIDELADLMMTAAKEVEDSVCRIAQMGRAAGVHLVIATQSPRADVITGLMKANIPSRIALRVSSALESRIILDAGGNADKLVGNGDMLYSPINANKPVRVQGTWVTDEERESIVEFIKRGTQANYATEVIDEIEKAAQDKSQDTGASADSSDDGEERDEMVPQAVEVILESGMASVSMLQRRLKLGYARAARIVDQLEEMGIVGPFEGAKPRPVLITRDQWHEMQFINGTAPVTPLPEPDDFSDLKATGGEAEELTD